LDTLCIENLVIESPKAEYWPWMEQKLGSALPREGMQSAYVPLLYLQDKTRPANSCREMGSVGPLPSSALIMLCS
jgi:hypothetical protein